MAKKYMTFLSHDWARDELGRDNHDRVRQINAKLQASLGAGTTWFDEANMTGDINDAMATGVEQSWTMVVFITSNYLTKVSGKGPKGLDDNCRFEFNLGLRYIHVAGMIPVVMEPSQTDAMSWASGLVSGKLGTKLYINLTDHANLDAKITELVQAIRAAGAAESSPETRRATDRYTLRRTRTEQLLQQGIDMRVQCQSDATDIDLGDHGTMHLKGEQAGQGMFGPVLKAIITSHSAAARNVAAKRMNKHHIHHGIVWRSEDDQSGVEAKCLDKPLEEMCLLKQLAKDQHANIIDYVCTLETPSHYFLVIEFGGLDLLTHLEAYARNATQGLKRQAEHLHLSLRERKVCFKQVAMGLAHLHGCGYCHLDLSTENVVARYDEAGEVRVKIIDFGLARPIRLKDANKPFRGVQKIAAEFAPGKFVCMAPEVYSEPEFDGMAADMWSIAIVLTDLLTPGARLWKIPSDDDPNFRVLARECMPSGNLHPLFRQVPEIEDLCRNTQTIAFSLFQVNPALRLHHTQLVGLLDAEWIDTEERSEPLPTSPTPLPRSPEGGSSSSGGEGAWKPSDTAQPKNVQGATAETSQDDPNAPKSETIFGGWMEKRPLDSFVDWRWSRRFIRLVRYPPPQMRSFKTPQDVADYLDMGFSYYVTWSLEPDSEPLNRLHLESDKFTGRFSETPVPATLHRSDKELEIRSAKHKLKLRNCAGRPCNIDELFEELKAIGCIDANHPWVSEKRAPRRLESAESILEPSGRFLQAPRDRDHSWRSDCF